MSVELRWARLKPLDLDKLEDETVTEWRQRCGYFRSPVLQYRTMEIFYKTWSPWKSVLVEEVESL
jgi:hypothetical protein